MRRILVVLGLIIAVFAVDVSSKIDRVTVFSGMAQVTRTAKINFSGAGEFSYTIRGIPTSVDVSSVRLKGFAKAGVKFGGIDMSPVYQEPDTGRIAEITERIKIIDDRLNALVQKREALNIEQQFLSNIGVIASSGSTRELQVGKVDPLSYQKTLEFLDKGLMDIADKTVEFGIAQRELLEEKNQLHREMNNLGGRRNKGFDATFVVKANSAGTADVEFSYNVSNANWFPSYDLRYMVEDGLIEVTYYGIVQQNSGEAWKNAEIVLSTSRPSAGAAAPTLSPWYLDIMQEFKSVVPSAPMMQSRANKSMAYEMMEDEVEMDYGSSAGAMIEVETAQVSGSGTVQFEIPGRTTIPKDYSQKKLTVSVFDLDAEESYITIPKLEERAYLNAKFKNTSEFPILAGQADIFQGQAYVGKRGLQHIATGQELELSMGMIEAIEVKRKHIEDFKEKGGIFGSKKKHNFGWTTEITNNTPREIEIVVKEQVPVSRNSVIEIEDVLYSPELTKEPKQGIFDWRLKIAAGKKAECSVRFTVEHPKNKNIQGL